MKAGLQDWCVYLEFKRRRRTVMENVFLTVAARWCIRSMCTENYKLQRIAWLMLWITEHVCTLNKYAHDLEIRLINLSYEVTYSLNCKSSGGMRGLKGWLFTLLCESYHDSWFQFFHPTNLVSAFLISVGLSKPFKKSMEQQKNWIISPYQLCTVNVHENNHISDIIISHW